MGKMTLVVDFLDGTEPAVNAGINILGGQLARVSWCDALAKLDKLEERFEKEEQIAADGGFISHELGKIVKLFRDVPMDDDDVELTKAYAELLHFYENLPEEAEQVGVGSDCGVGVGGSAQGGVSTADFKYAKMQTVHQMLVERSSAHGHLSVEDAVHLARLVDAAYGAIDAPPQPALEQSPAGDIDLYAADFSDALTWLKQGLPVARKSWRAGWFLSLDKEIIRLVVPGHAHKAKEWLIEASSDLLATDWCVVS